MSTARAWRVVAIGIGCCFAGWFAGSSAVAAEQPTTEPAPEAPAPASSMAAQASTADTANSSAATTMLADDPMQAQLDLLTQLLGGPMPGDRPGQPAPLAGIDLYWRKFWDPLPATAPVDDPYFVPWATLKQHTHATLIHEPSDVRRLSQAMEYLPGGTWIDRGARGTRGRLTWMGAGFDENRFTVDGADATLPGLGLPLTDYAGYTGLRLVSDRYAEIWHAVGRVVALGTPESAAFNGVSGGGGAGPRGTYEERVSAHGTSAVGRAVVGQELLGRRANGHDNSSLTVDQEWARAVTALSPGHTVTVSGQRFGARRGFYESNNVGLGATDDPNDTERYRFAQAQVESLWAPDESIFFHVALGGQQQERVEDRTADGGSFTDQLDKTRLTRASVRAQLGWLFESENATRLAVTVSGLAQTERYKRKFKSIDETGQTVLGSVAVELGNREICMFNTDVTVYGARGIETVLLPGIRLRIPLQFRAMTWEEEHSLVFGWSKRVQTASYEQRFLNDFTQVGNPDLKPTLVTLFQAGYEYRCPFLEITGEYQHRHYEDQIVPTTAAFPSSWTNLSGQDVQAGHITVRSFPVDARFQALRLHLPFFGDYTYVDARDANDVRVIDRPRHDIKIGYEAGVLVRREGYEYPAAMPAVEQLPPPYVMRLGAQWHYRDGWKADLNEPPVSPFYTLDGFASLVPLRSALGSLEVRIDALNLTKRRAMTDLGHRMEGLSWIAGVNGGWRW